MSNIGYVIIRRKPNSYVYYYSVGKEDEVVDAMRRYVNDTRNSFECEDKVVLARILSHKLKIREE